MENIGLEKNYNPSSFEDRIYKEWTEKGYFHAEVDEKKKEAAVEASRSEYAGGSMAPLAANTTAIKYTKDRCNYLISLIN